MSYPLTEVINNIIPQLMVLAIGWVFREAYRLTKSVNDLEEHAQRNRELIKGLHDLDDVEDAINASA